MGEKHRVRDIDHLFCVKSTDRTDTYAADACGPCGVAAVVSYTCLLMLRITCLLQKYVKLSLWYNYHTPGHYPFSCLLFKNVSETGLETLYFK
jgi:hypothetical protein